MSQVSRPQVSIVIPSYNNEHELQRTLSTMHQYLDKYSYSHQLIVINDGSTDGTETMLRDAQSLYPQLQVLTNDRNRGKGYSVRRGVLEAAGDFVVYTDADLAYPIETIELLLAPLQDGTADVAVGSRMHPLSDVRLHPRHFGYLYRRHLLSRAFNFLVRRLFRLSVTDIQCGLKGFKDTAARSVFSLVTIPGFAFDVEAMLIAHRLQYRISEVPLSCVYQSDMSTVRILANAGGVLRDLLNIFVKFQLRHYRLPTET